LDRDRAQEELTAARAEVIALRTALQGAQEELAHKVHQLEMMMKKMQATAETASAAANAKIHALEGELAKRGWRRTVFG
jgi:flagellar capping protein FliD